MVKWWVGSKRVKGVHGLFVVRLLSKLALSCACLWIWKDLPKILLWWNNLTSVTYKVFFVQMRLRDWKHGLVLWVIVFMIAIYFHLIVIHLLLFRESVLLFGEVLFHLLPSNKSVTSGDHLCFCSSWEEKVCLRFMYIQCLCCWVVRTLYVVRHERILEDRMQMFCWLWSLAHVRHIFAVSCKMFPEKAFWAS